MSTNSRPSQGGPVQPVTLEDVGRLMDVLDHHANLRQQTSKELISSLEKKFEAAASASSMALKKAVDELHDRQARQCLAVMDAIERANKRPLDLLGRALRAAKAAWKAF